MLCFPLNSVKSIGNVLETDGVVPWGRVKSSLVMLSACFNAKGEK